MAQSVIQPINTDHHFGGFNASLEINFDNQNKDARMQARNQKEPDGTVARPAVAEFWPLGRFPIMKINKWSFCVLLLVLFSVSGCATGRNALQGWKAVQQSSADCPFNKSICDDYKSYVDKLTSEQKLVGLSIGFYEDGSGRHAVVISNVWKEGWMFNYSYDHVLIYSKSNKRIKIIKYRTGKFMC